MDKLIQEDEIEIPFKSFQWYGFFIGGILPIVVFILFLSIGLSEATIDRNAVGFILVSCIVATKFSYILSHYRGKKEKSWYKIVYFFQALISFFLIHIVVTYTGGARNSVFSFSYLYIPSIIGYSYGLGINLFGASILLTTSYISNLFYYESMKSSMLGVVNVFNGISINSKPNESIRLSLLYFLIFLIQLIVIIIIADQKSKSSSSENGKS